MNTPEPLGTFEVALRHAARLLERDPAAAVEQAAEILKVHPDQPDALAISGLALGRLGQGEEAIAALRRAVHLKPVLHEAWRQYRDHLLPIVGLSLVGSVERAFVQYAGPGLPGWASVTLEVLVWGIRGLLVVLLVRWVLLADGRLRGVRLVPGLGRLARFARRHWPALLLQLGGFAAAFLVLDTLPDLAIAPLVPEPARPTYRAVLLAVKNPTVIAFTLVWELALLRQALLRGAEGLPEQAR